ncbi:MAG: hypothetical protein IT433_05915 [Phycisphaerales bacterium]|nr:hypothetical protein [Phycisphaerales bacterium]
MTMRSIRRGGSRTAILACVAGMAVAAATAQAQVRDWNGGSGSWHLASNWSPGDVPDTGGEIAQVVVPGAYTISVTSTVNVGSVQAANATATIAVSPGIEFRLAGSSTNSGVILINASGVNSSTLFRMLNPLLLDGTGYLRLNAFAANLNSAYIADNGGGQTLTNGISHRILGVGAVYSHLVNNGQVVADVAGARLDLNGATKTNNGTFRAQGGAELTITSATVNQAPTARITADAAQVSICNSTISGGTIEAINGGDVRTTCTNHFSSVGIEGPFFMEPGHEARLITQLALDGTLTVNRNATNSTTLIRSVNNVDLIGTGQIVLNANSGNLDSAHISDNGGGQVLSNLGPTIRGSGRIYSNFVNTALVTADAPGRGLSLYGATKTNSGVLRAESGGTLDITATTLNQTGAGEVRALGGDVLICNSTISGGRLVAMPGFQIRQSCTSHFGGVQIEGAFTVDPGREMRLTSGIVNQGVITINTGAVNSGTLMRSLVSLTVSGGGVIELNAHPSNLDSAHLLDNGGGQVLTNADNTIRGAGRIYSNFDNDGLVDANISGRTLDLYGSTKVNRSLIRSTNGANLGVTACTVNQLTGPGELLAADSTISVSTGTIRGGLLRSTGPSGLIIITSTSHLQDGVVFSGVMQLYSGNELRLASANALTNNGQIIINPSAINAGTLVRALTSTTLAGSGALVLNAFPSNLDSAYLSDNGGGQVTTNASSHTIRGCGTIHSNFTNDGQVLADLTGRTLRLYGSTKVNNNVMRAMAGGFLDITSATLNQSASGLVEAESGSTVRICSSSVTGGTVRALPGGLWDVSCTTHVNGVTFEGDGQMAPGNEFRMVGGITNHGRFVINSTGTNSGTLARALNSMAISGTGTFLLNANPVNLDSAYLSDHGGGQVITNGAGHEIAGRGRFHCTVVNQGILAPGDGPASVGSLQPRRDLTCTATSEVRIDVMGPGNAAANFDTISSNSPITIDGTLYARASGYTPGLGETFDIITGSSRSGTFAVTDTKGFRVDYLPNGVRLTAICEPDVNEDGNVDQDDVLYLINVIGGAENPTGIDPDFNRDGNVDQDDVGALINAVAGGGC